MTFFNLAPPRVNVPERDWSAIDDFAKRFQQGRADAQTGEAIDQFAQGLDPETAKQVAPLLRDPQTREYGLKLVMERMKGPEFKVDIAPDGTPLRINEQAGTVEAIGKQGQYAKPRSGYGEMGGRIPAGFQPSPDGGLMPIPGGPADPDYIREREPQKLRNLPNGVVNKLTDAGSNVEDIGRIAGGFQDDFAGYGSQAVGDAAIHIARNYGVGNKDSAAWWQDYQDKKNVRRNALFGSALTVPEKQEFEKADVNPGMKPDLIRKNLQRQEAAATRAARKLAKVYKAQGYSDEQIEGALGIPLEEVMEAAPAAPAGVVPAEVPKRRKYNPETGAIE